MNICKIDNKVCEMLYSQTSSSRYYSQNTGELVDVPYKPHDTVGLLTFIKNVTVFALYMCIILPIYIMWIPLKQFGVTVKWGGNKINSIEFKCGK